MGVLNNHYLVSVVEAAEETNDFKEDNNKQEVPRMPIVRFL